MSMLDYYMTLENARGTHDFENIPELMSRVILFAHGFMAKKGVAFATSLPGARESNGELSSSLGSKVRFFCAHREALDDLSDAFDDHRWISKVFRTSGTKRTPKDFDGKWMRLERFKIKSTRADGTDNSQNRYIQAGFKPYSRVETKSTGQSFNLHLTVEKLATDDLIRAGVNPWEQRIFPNGYGIATPSKTFYLPVI